MIYCELELEHKKIVTNKTQNYTSCFELIYTKVLLSLVVYVCNTRVLTIPHKTQVK